MLLNLVHLLPDLSGALICPKERLLAFADPCRKGDKAASLGPVVKQMTAVLRQRRPARVIWLGSALPELVEADGRHLAELGRLVQAHDWTWVAEGGAHTLPGRMQAECKAGDLIFREIPDRSARPGEINGALAPLATCDGVTHPCFVLDGRRLILPAFGPRRDGGTDVMSAPVQPLFRRPFQVLMLDHGRIVTRPRARLDGAKASLVAGGRKLSLFGESTA